MAPEKRLTDEEKRLARMVKLASRREPWTSPDGSDELHRLGSTKVPLRQRRMEFQRILKFDVAVALRKLCPGHPPIPIIQMLDMDMDNQGLDEGIIGAGDLVRNEDQWKGLIGPAMTFHNALTRIGLTVSFRQVIGPKRSEKDLFSNYYYYLFISLPKRPA